MGYTWPIISIRSGYAVTKAIQEKFASFQILHLDSKSKTDLNVNSTHNKSYKLDLENWEYFELKDVFTL